MMSVLVQSLLCTVLAPAPSPATSIDGAAAPVVTTWATPRRVTPPPPAAEGVPGLTFVTTNVDPEGDMPRNVVFTADGSAAVIVNRDTDVLTFFDVATRMITHTVGVGDFPVDVAVTPDGRYALAPNVLDNTVSVVDIATHSVAAHVPVTGDQPFRVAVSSDSSFAVVAVINDAVTSSFSVIDLATLSETLSFPSSGQGAIGFFGTPESGIFGSLYTQFVLTPDDATIVLPDFSNSSVRLYDVATGALDATLAVSAGPRAVDVSADGTLAVVTHEAAPAGITEIDLVARSVTGFNPTASSLVSQIVRITPDKTHAIAAISNNAIFVNLATGATTATLSTGSIGDIEISFDGQYAFVSNFNARIIDIASQTIVRTIPFAPCYDVAVSPVEHRAVALNNRFREDIHLYDIDGPAGFFEGFALSGEPPEGDATRSLAMSPDGTTVVAGNNTSRNVSIINIASGTVRAMVDTGDRPLGLMVSPDGATAVVCNGDANTISVIDLTTDTNVADVPIPTRPVDVRISPDSTTAYVTSVSGADRLHFVDLAGPASAVTGSLLTGQMGSIIYTYTVTSGIELSPDGSILALCYSFDDELGIIDTAAQTELVRVPVGDFPIRVAFAPDGSTAYVVNSFSDDLYVVDIDGAGSSVVAVVPGIDFPLTVNVDDAGDFVYVGSFGVGGIGVVSTATNSIVGGLVLGSAPRAAHLSGDTLYLAMTGGEFLRISAAGPATAVIDATPLTAGPSDMVFSGSRNIAVVAQPIPDGVDLVRTTPLGDLDRDGMVGIVDFLILLGEWGPCPDPPDTCAADLNGDGVVGIVDFLLLLANWTA